MLHHGAWLIAALALLAGCGTFAAFEPSAPTSVATTPAAFPDTACRAVARQRADDASVNGLDTALQGRIARDSYVACMAVK